MLEVEAWTDKATCPRCGSSSSNLHQNHGYWVRDLPISNRQVRLKVNRRQFKCKICKKPFSEGRCGKGNDILLEWKYEMLPLQLKSDSQERTS